MCKKFAYSKKMYILLYIVCFDEEKKELPLLITLYFVVML